MRLGTRSLLKGSLAAMAACLLLTGCGSRRTPPVQSAGSQPAETDRAGANEQGGSSNGQQSATSNTTNPASPDTAVPNDDEQVDPSHLASVGPQDARRGNTITGGGIVTEPIKQYFSIQHRLIFMNLQKAEDLYNATHGRMPRSHDEYMQEIIDANQIELPELQPGWDYYYDAEREELMRRKTS